MEEETRVDHGEPSAEHAVRLVGATLSVYVDDDVWRLYFVGPSGGIMGRGEEAEFPFDDPTISRLHARLALADDQFVIEDMGSVNGTFVDGERAEGLTVLPMRCSLRLGKNVTIRFAAVDQHEQEDEYRRVLTEERLRLEREKNAALARQARELQRANDDLAQFLSAASHDLREPLRTVRSYTDLCLERYAGRLDDRATRYLEFAAGGAGRMEQLLDDLLHYIRVGRDEAQPEDVDLAELAGEVVADLDKALRDSEGEVFWRDLPTVRGHRSQLRQLLQNLIGNGLKFHGDEPPRIEIAAELDPDRWHLTFRDNGIGIDSTGVERIFELFHRLHTADEYPGTGLGLTISRKIVDYHGGEIWVESRLDHGSTFHVTLPTQVAGIEADDRHEQTLD